MDFQIQFLSFYVINIEDHNEQSAKKYKHFQTLDEAEYEQSALKDFLDGELAKITKRKVDRHPKSDVTPTRIGRFIVEPGHELDSNPNYNIFNHAILATNKEEFSEVSESFVAAYLDTSAIRGGAFLVATARPRKYFDDSFVFIMKCDFEPKVATISDESTLIRHVEMAITTKNMKSIQYPHMPEEGMIEKNEVKIHQASHARYFQDFLKYVEYGESMPEIMKTQVKTMVEEHFQEVYEDNDVELERFEQEMEVWEASPKREIQERLTPTEVVEASAQIIEHTPEIELKMKLDHVAIEGLLADFGESIHLAKVNDRYVLMIEADTVTFEKGVSPIEFLKPGDLQELIDKIQNR